MSSDKELDSLNLDRQLCFALYAASRAMTRAYQPMLRELGITYPQYLVLLVLWQWENEGRELEECTVSALGEQLMLDSGTLTPLLKRMEVQGHVTRARSKRDERVTLIRITTSAQQLRQDAKVWRDKALSGLSLPRARMAALHEELWALLAELRAATVS
ncbi:MarR family winged helix-turn-helix transcriptional regulator [Microbulbifer salipaludis]